MIKEARPAAIFLTRMRARVNFPEWRIAAGRDAPGGVPTTYYLRANETATSSGYNQPLPTRSVLGLLFYLGKLNGSMFAVVSG